MDENDFLASLEEDNDARPEPVEVKVVETQPEPPSEPETVAEPPAQVVPAEQPRPEPGHVPIAALLDTRDKLKAAEALAQSREQELAQYRAQQQQPQQRPDMFEDSDGYDQSVDQRIQSATLNTRLDLSEDFARSRYDDATVDAARDWALSQAKANPVFGQQLLSNRNPYEFAVKEHKRVQALDKLGGDTSEIDQFLAWKAAQAAPAPIAGQPPGQATTVSPSIPPRSLASAPSAGGVSAQVEISPEDAFKDTFSTR